jgi:hypothetical protein
VIVRREARVEGREARVEETMMTDAPGTRDDGADEDGTAKEDGLGQEGTIPSEPGSVGVGAGEPTTFEPEEDPDAAARRDPKAPDGAGAGHSDSDGDAG